MSFLFIFEQNLKMKRIFILALLFSTVLYPASLKSGIYKAEYDYSKVSENTYIREKIIYFKLDIYMKIF